MAETIQVAVLGAGPGGYAAAFYAADLGLQVALIDEEKNPGGVCLYRGCIPSKALLHVAKVVDDAKHAGSFGVTFGEPAIDVDKLRSFKQWVVDKLTAGVGGIAKMRKVRFIQGRATLTPKQAAALGVVDADFLLVAVGRIPNSDELAVSTTGVAVDASGFVETDAHLRTTVDGVWALGDITNPAMLKHTANAEAKVIAHNIEHPDAITGRGKRERVHPVLRLVPAGADAEDGAPAADVIDRHHLLGEDGRIAVSVAVHQHPDSGPRGQRGQGRQQRRGLQRRPVGIAVERQEVIEQPERIEPRSFGQLPVLHQPRPGVLMLPGHHAERDVIATWQWGEFLALGHERLSFSRDTPLQGG